MDITLTEGLDGRALAHRPDCPVVLALREMGAPLMTMFDVQAPLVELTCEKHSCLDAAPITHDVNDTDRVHHSRDQEGER
jgi:hypothetical protein